MKYSKEFEDAVNFAQEQNLFLGYGNPNGKILMIGKEQYYESKEKLDSDEFYTDLLEKRLEVNRLNIESWLKNIEEKFEPNWNSEIDRVILDSNAQTIYLNQRNVRNQLLKTGKWNQGTSSTYLHYQKLYQNIFLGGKKEDQINFQKEFFLSELNDLVAKKDYKFQKLKELKKEFISDRQKLFNLPFFKSFPVVIIASGHYSRDFNFDIEKTFNVEWDKETKISDNCWYNLHYSSDKKRLVVHTRQLSNRVNKALINDLSKLVKEFLYSSIN